MTHCGMNWQVFVPYASVWGPLRGLLRRRLRLPRTYASVRSAMAQGAADTGVRIVKVFHQLFLAGRGRDYPRREHHVEGD
ncbi:hypothetical protein N800_11835 [Lysobacter daejeonensis GH1-9]|uniref:Uncharacterized protein n=1 Tax=Lysobacter daejeonensis GH1-9 TaxID=1385517 RepID=A0A0A0EZT2_9GAMM|nr:hypothetical protein N800_11835 [Lysobacter daejeonensis GH1-9]